MFDCVYYPCLQMEVVEMSIFLPQRISVHHIRRGRECTFLFWIPRAKRMCASVGDPLHHSVNSLEFIPCTFGMRQEKNLQFVPLRI